MKIEHRPDGMTLITSKHPRLYNAAHDEKNWHSEILIETENYKDIEEVSWFEYFITIIMTYFF